jgi:hypothetical protein
LRNAGERARRKHGLQFEPAGESHAGEVMGRGTNWCEPVSNP